MSTSDQSDKETTLLREKLERIKESKRKSAQKIRANAKQGKTMTKSDFNKERTRVIKQTVSGGSTHLDKFMPLKIDLSVLSDYCVNHNININNIKPHIIDFLTGGQNTQTDANDDKYDDIFTLEKFMGMVKSQYTAKNYLSHINSIKQLMGYSSNKQFIEYVKNKPENICDKLNQEYKENMMSYISPIMFVIRNFDEIKQFVGEEPLRVYTEKLAEYKQYYDYLKMNKTEGILSWDQIVDYRTKIDPKFRYGLSHLLISLYTCIPPMRDDFGLVKIISDDSQLNDMDNFYVINTNMLHFNHYKTVESYKSFKFKVPIVLRDVIIGSLKLNPRQYLITQNLNKSEKPYNNGKLTALISSTFKLDHNTNLTINDFRHAFETYMGQYGIDFELEEKRYINQIVGHDSNQRDFYIRDHIRSKPLFKEKPEKNTDIIQRISDKIGGFYDIGDKIVPHQPPPPTSQK